jgi:hypothetical protein
VVQRAVRLGCAAVVAALLPVLAGAQTPPPAPAPSAATAAPRGISDAQFAKLIADLAANGSNGTVPPTITRALGLTAAGETLTVRQDTVLDNADPSHAAHTFLKLTNGNVIVANVNVDATTIRVYYATPRLVLISALIARKPPGGLVGSDITMLNTAASVDAWNAELGALATIAGKL